MTPQYHPSTGLLYGHQASMIVIGSHGRTGLSHLLVGSKAERVVQLSTIPVTVVKGSTKK